jgi:hypothetical protein
MVSKTKTKTRKKGKQTRGTKKSKPAKKKGAKRTSARGVRPKKLSTRARRSTAQRSRVSKPSEQENKLLTPEGASTLSSTDENIRYSEYQGELQPTTADATLQEPRMADQSSPAIEGDIEDTDSSTSEIV